MFDKHPWLCIIFMANVSISLILLKQNYIYEGNMPITVYSHGIQYHIMNMTLEIGGAQIELALHGVMAWIQFASVVKPSNKVELA